MNNLIDVHKKSLEAFCVEHGYSFDKLKTFPRCGNESILYIQTYNEKDASLGLNNNKPAEILLSLVVNEQGVSEIKTSKNAEKYLMI